MNRSKKPAPKRTEKEFDYIDELRESGITDMWKGNPLFQNENCISLLELAAAARKEARHEPKQEVGGGYPRNVR